MTDIFPDPSFYYHEAALFIDRSGIRTDLPQDLLLKSILKAFAQLPYENLSKIIKYRRSGHQPLKIRLPDEVFEENLRYGLGGTCFSLTFSLLSLLHITHFDAYPVMADMRYGPNTHCALVIQIADKKYLIDPGYLLTNPLLLNPAQGSRIKTAVSVVDLVFNSSTEDYHLFTIQAGERKWRYQWKDQVVDWESFHRYWIASFHWNGMRGLCLNKISEDRMVYVHKNYLRETTIHGKRNHKIKHDYHQKINEVFGINTEIVEEALAAVNDNLEYDRMMGLWVPKQEIHS